jgi:hypothetical protein
MKRLFAASRTPAPGGASSHSWQTRIPTPNGSAEQQAQQLAIAEGTVRAFELGKKHNVNMAWGTDILFNPRGTATQGRQLAKIARWFDNADVLRLATSRNAALLALSGPRNPYPGALGVIDARRPRRSAGDRRQSSGGRFASRGSREEHEAHHEGWPHPQEHPESVRG